MIKAQCLRTAIGFLLLAVMFALPGAAAAETAALSMTIAPGSDAARIIVEDDAAQQPGRYRLTLPLTLRAEISGDGSGQRIIGARLLIKDEAQEALSGGANVPVGATSWIVSETFTFDARAQGPLAQNAKVACAASVPPGGGKARQASMLLPVVWRVTAGRFGFARLAAGGLQPDADMMADARFYGDQHDVEAETAIAVTIDCPPGGEDVVAASSAKPAPQSTAKTAPAGKGKVKSAAPVVKVAAEPADDIREGAMPAAISGFTCEGGIVRETLAGPGHEVCLCPGHTSRRQTGERAFACEKRFARKR